MATMIPPSLKTCTRCHKPKPITDFDPDGRRTDDLRPYCRDCNKRTVPIAPWLKECSRCGHILPTQDFFVTSKSKDGLSYYCKECDRTAYQHIPQVAVNSRTCPKCGIVKPASAFHRDMYRKNGLKGRCKECCSTAKHAHLVGFKVCRDCKIEKPLSEFYRQAELKQGTRNRCRDCEIVRKRDYNLRVNYGIGNKEYEELFEAQHGLCAVCKKPASVARYGKELPLHVDHCHTTDAVRGLLCSQCNTALGQLREDPEIIEAMLAYVKERVLY